MHAAFFNGMLEKLGIAPRLVFDEAQTAALNRRRELRGSRQQPVLDKSQAYSWLPGFQQAAEQHREACTRVFDTYEERINKFGYSLKHPKRILPTALLRLQT